MLPQWKDLLALFFPPFCLACLGPVAGQDALICPYCQADLPLTRHWLGPDNSMEQRFWGRVHFVRAAAFLRFQKGNMVQNLLHFLKYDHREDLGEYLGNWFGRELAQGGQFTGVDWVIPVPIHPKRLRKRGYNQITAFSHALSRQMGKTCREDLLIRVSHSRTQTTRSRDQRFAHLEKAFKWTKPEELAGRHLLLVDDILTTGATLEACCGPLEKLSGVQVSLCTLAIAE